MRLTIGQLAAKISKTVSSGYKRIYRKSTGKWERIVSKNETGINEAIERPPVENSSENVGKAPENIYRRNEMEIQMLSAQLYEQVFRNCVPKTSKTDAVKR